MSMFEGIVGKRISMISCRKETFHSIENDTIETVEEILVEIDKWTMCITNPVRLDPKLASIEDLVGATIDQINSTDEKFRVSTDKGWFSVDIRRESFVGPEAMVIYGPENLIVVWN
jgi:hypothetical protein